MSEDIAKILSAQDLSYGTKFVVLADATWVWSEFDGKYTGCKYWSIAAGEAKSDKDRCHEHVIPKKCIILKLFELDSPTGESVYKILDTYCVGAVITRAEDKKLTKAGFRFSMPPDWDKINVWARYLHADIKMKECLV